MQPRVFLSILAVVLVTGVVGCSSLRGGRGEEESAGRPVSLGEVPEAARARIEQLTAGGTIRRLEQAQEGGRTVYDVEATVLDRDVEYDVADDGTVLSSGLSVPFDALPITVRAAAEQYFGLSPILKAAVEVEGGETFYEVEGKKGRRPITLKLTEAGQIVEEEKE